MVVGVIPGVDTPIAPTAGDKATRAAVANPRSIHGVFAVVAGFFFRQDAFVVAEALVVVVWVGIWPAMVDKGDGVVRFAGQG